MLGNIGSDYFTPHTSFLQSDLLKEYCLFYWGEINPFCAYKLYTFVDCEMVLL